MRELAADPRVTLVNSVNPHRIEGQKTAAFEVVDELGDAPEVLAIPVGNAGNITAYWRGFREYFAEGLCMRLPRCSAAGPPARRPGERGPVEEPRTVASAIRIGNPASWQGAIDARDQSEGAILAVDDADILAAQRPGHRRGRVLRARVGGLAGGAARGGARRHGGSRGHRGLRAHRQRAQGRGDRRRGIRAPTAVDGDAASLAAALGL